jgi:hypothetical protein
LRSDICSRIWGLIYLHYRIWGLISVVGFEVWYLKQDLWSDICNRIWGLIYLHYRIWGLISVVGFEVWYLKQDLWSDICSGICGLISVIGFEIWYLKNLMYDACSRIWEINTEENIRIYNMSQLVRYAYTTQKKSNIKSYCLKC